MMQEWLGLQPAPTMGELKYVADMSALPAGPVVRGLLSATMDEAVVVGPLLEWTTEVAPEWEQLCRDLPRSCTTRIRGPDMRTLSMRTGPRPLEAILDNLRGDYCLSHAFAPDGNGSAFGLGLRSRTAHPGARGQGGWAAAIGACLRLTDWGDSTLPRDPPALISELRHSLSLA